jgi:hypothetical protein
VSIAGVGGRAADGGDQGDDGGNFTPMSSAVTVMPTWAASGRMAWSQAMPGGPATQERPGEVAPRRGDQHHRPAMAVSLCSLLS